MKKIILLCMASVLLSQCGDVDSDNISGLPYVKFTKESKASLIPKPLYTVGESILFKNEEGNTLEFIVQENDVFKRLESHGSWVVGSYNYFYYDEQFIHLCPAQLYPTASFNSTFYIALRQWPDSFEVNHPDRPSKESSLRTIIGFDIFPNVYSSITVPENSGPFTVVAGGVTYTDAKRAEVPEDGETITNTSLPLIKYIYFVPLKGIVGFDDRENHTWRVQ